MSYDMNNDISHVILSEEEISQIVSSLGAKLSEDYADKNPLVISVLRGAFVFVADLLRAITIPCEIDFMAVSSYGAAMTSSGVVKIVKDLSTSIEGRHVIIAEDILDSGITLKHLTQLLSARKPASIRICAFAVKDVPGKPAAIDADYEGARVPNEFIVGYGLDYAEKYRNLPYVGVLKPEVYS